MSRPILIAALLSVLVGTLTGENQQSWSKHTYNDEPYNLTCKVDKYQLKPNDIITWNRHGMSGDLVTNDHYEIRDSGGVPNVQLHFKKVTDELHGIYVCHVMDLNQNFVGSSVMGLNWGSRLYHDDIDKYREKLIVGAIAGGSTLFLIVFVCLISNFRYLSEESLEKRRERKEEWARQQTMGNGGYKNHGYSTEMAENPSHSQPNGNNATDSSYVHF